MDLAVVDLLTDANNRRILYALYDGSKSVEDIADKLSVHWWMIQPRLNAMRLQGLVIRNCQNHPCVYEVTNKGEIAMYKKIVKHSEPYK
jgi:predicted transcriptional regulator